MQHIETMDIKQTLNVEVLQAQFYLAERHAAFINLLDQGNL